MFSHSVVSKSLQPHGLQQARTLCPLLSPRVCSNLCPLRQWCHLTIYTSAPHLLCLLSVSQHQDSSMSWLVASYGQSIRSSVSARPSNEYWGLVSFFHIEVWFPCCPTDSQESSPAQFESISSSAPSLYGPTLTSIHDTRKTIALTIQTFVSKVLSLLFNMLSRWLFLPRSKHLLISWLQSPSTVM